jgi:predicted Zn-dependent protease
LVLLHQLAHTLDAQHDSELNGMMSATYSPAAVASISEANRTRMLSVLDERLSAAARYREAEQLLARRDAAGAAAVLAPVVPLYPARAKPRVLRCRIELAQGARDAATSALCDAAATTSAESALAVAAARRGAADIEGAQRTLALAEERTASVALDKQAAMWLGIAGEYRELGAITRAENALTKAGTETSPRSIAAWAATTRARYGIPRDGARWHLTVDDEAAAVTAVRNAFSQVNASQWDAAANAIDEAERRWPALPGVLAAHCALDFRRDKIASARRLCERALAEGGSSWTLYLLGTMNLEERGGNPAVGTAQLRDAVARDPDLVQAWQKLARVLARARATTELEQLRSDYRARFNASLSD